MVKLWRAATWLVVGSVVSGCVNPYLERQLQQQQLQRQAIAEREQIESECANYGVDPRTEALSGKVPLTLAEANAPPALAQLTDNNKASAKEKAALIALEEVRGPCIQRMFAWAGRYLPPAAVSLFEQAQTNGKLLRARLYAGEITYGEWHRATYEAQTRFKTALADLDASLQQQALAAQHAYAAQQQAAALQQQAAAAQLQNALQYFQLQNQSYYQSLPATPITTRCYRVGQSVNCQSW